MLCKHEASAKTAEVCRRHGIRCTTFDGWKAKFGGIEPSVAKRLKALEGENAKPEHLRAEAMLENTVLKDRPTKDVGAHRQARGRRASRIGLRDE